MKQMFHVPNDSQLRGEEYTLWLQLYGDAPECRETRRSTIAAFKEMFPTQHNHSVKSLFTDLAEMAAAGEEFTFPFHRIDNVHPRAWELILKYGRDFQPAANDHTSFAEEKRQPAQSYCFLNSFEMMRTVREQKPTARISYVGGFVVGPIVYPMLHAWNGVGFSKRCVDWTFYAASRWTRYFGIPFTYEEYVEIMRRSRPDNHKISLLFRKDCFEQTEEHVLAVLEQSRRRHPPVTSTSII